MGSYKRMSLEVKLQIVIARNEGDSFVMLGTGFAISKDVKVITRIHDVVIASEV